MSDEKELLERIAKLGYRVRKPGHYAKVSLYVHEDTLLKFKQVAEELEYKIVEAATEALDLWLESKKEDLRLKRERKP